MWYTTILAHGDEGGAWQLFLQPPPLHPILVNLTAGLIPVAVGFDLLGRWLRRESLASAGFWMTMVAAAVTPFTALAGWLWMDDMGGGGEAMVIHKWLGTALAAIIVALAVWRWSIRRRHAPQRLTLTERDTFRRAAPDRHAGPGAAYLAVAVLFVLSLAVQGHLGGMMSFGEEHHEPPAGESAPAAAAPTTAPISSDAGWKYALPAPTTKAD